MESEASMATARTTDRRDWSILSPDKYRATPRVARLQRSTGPRNSGRVEVRAAVECLAPRLVELAAGFEEELRHGADQRVRGRVLAGAELERATGRADHGDGGVHAARLLGL